MSATDKVKTGSEHAEPRMYEPSMEEILASIRRIIADDHTLPGRSQERDGETNLRAALEGAQSRGDRSAGFPAPQDKPTFLRGTADSAAVYRHPAAPQAPVQVADAAPLAEAVTPVSRPAPQPVLPQSQAAPQPQATPQPASQPQAVLQPQGRIAAPQFAMPDAPVARQAGVPNAAYTEVPALEPAAEALVAEAPVAPSPVPQHEMPEAAPALISGATAKTVLEAFSRLTASRLADRDAFIKDVTNELLRPMLKGWLDEHLPALVERLVQAEIERLHGSR